MLCAISGLALETHSDQEKLVSRFNQDVDRRLALPDLEKLFYAALLEEAFAGVGRHAAIGPRTLA